MKQTAATSLFREAQKRGASDVHVAAGSPVMLRIDGELRAEGSRNLTAAQALSVVRSALSPADFKRLQKDREIDVSLPLPGGVRVRVNCHFTRGNVGLAARLIPPAIPSLEELGLRELAALVFELRSGLVLVTGPTGAGKSTALASLIHAFNEREARSIVTLEDPVEFVFPKGKGIVRQREYGQDFLSFPEALKRVLRQDPDIVMVGEMRDPETVAAALTLAETGHLILATLHTPDAVQTVDRIVDVFPPHQQAQVRSQLSLSLKMIIAQQLLPGAKGGRIALREVLVNTPAVAHTVRDGRAQELPSVMQTGEDAGMVTFAKAAKKLYKDGAITKEVFEAVTRPGR
ncbi:MAG: PilT/PilU family type 4a pilus ATPase [Candidatus Peribacteraceae bacterium]|nr:PilT/PilU family type 4a pilus ATPase [Candidatus Peribacteraceae bacterium]